MNRLPRVHHHWVAWAAGALVLAATAAVTWIIIREGRRAPGSAPAAAGAKEAAVPQLQVPAALVKSEPDLGVAGVVLLPDGAPAPGARVRLYRALSAWPEWQREELESRGTSTDGTFQFNTPRGPGLLVEFQHDDYAGELTEASALVPRLLLRLQPGFVVSGRVTGPGQRVPVRVTLEPAPGEQRRVLATDASPDGTFAFKNVPAGSVRVAARTQDWQPAVLPMVTVGASRGLELRFSARALSLQGKVVTLSQPQRPVQGARVRALPNVSTRDLFEPVETRTRPDGTFQLLGLGQGNVRLEVRHPEWSTSSRPVPVSASSPNVVFEMVPRSEVRGQLHGLEQALPAATRLDLSLRSAAGELGRCRAESDGSFAFPGLFSLGNATLETRGGAVAFARSSGAELPLQIEEGARNELDLDVLPPSVVTGRVVDQEGMAIAGATLLDAPEILRLSAPERVLAVADAAGRFRIQGLAARTVTLRVSAPDRASQRVDVAVPGPGSAVQVPDVVLSPGGRIRGTVLRGQDPLPGALVQAVGPGVGATVSRDDGSFLLTDLSPGSYRVRARYSSLPLAFAAEPVAVTAGATAGPAELRFPAGRMISGRVLGRDDQAVEGAVISVRGLAGSGPPIVTDPMGSFAIEVPRKAVELQVDSGDVSAQARQPIPADSDGDVTIRLNVPPTATITARMLALPGRKPVASVQLRVIVLGDVEGPAIRPRWLEPTAGVLRYRFVPAEHCLVIFQSEGFAPRLVELDQEPGSEQDLGEILFEPGAALRGRVVDEASAPVAGCGVWLGTEADLRDFTPACRTDADGNFLLQGVATATPNLVAAAPGFAPCTVRLRLPEDVLRRQPLPVVLQRGERIEVKVQGGGSAGQVVVLERDGLTLATAEVDDDGTAVFLHRGAGDYRVHLLGQPDGPAVRLDGKGEGQRVELR